ncbi:MAG: YegS/Rv2252/BmrU family lipid kinase [Clostridia bacterium]|nr:YegS/Rv2252/BmrU family lipid kinase [Clostridia bacterium]
MYKTLMIVNLEAGKGDFENQLSFVVMELKNNGFDVVIKYTEKDFGANKIIEQYKFEYDLLLVCGGDGTLNQAVTALTKIDKKVSVAFIPIGTTNDFAKNLNLPKNGIEIAQNIINSKALKADTGVFNEKYFNCIASFGVFAENGHKSDRKSKKGFVVLDFLLNSIKKMKSIKSYKMKVYFDDEIMEDEFIYVGISNSVSIGGLKWFDTEEISLNDGKVEVILIKKPQNIFRLFWNYKIYIIKRLFKRFKYYIFSR